MLYVFLNVNQMQTIFFEFLDTQHPSIKFTFKKQVDIQTLFLGILVRDNGDQFCKTVIGLSTNYLGFTPFSFKVGFVRTLLHCAFMISSSLFLFHEEVVRIMHYF